MKKVIYKQYGSKEVLQMAEVEMPTVSPDTLLMKVKAVSINPLDWKIFRGYMKPMSGSKFPKGVGIDFSGVVEKTGSEITRFKTGDEVFGLLDVFKGGALAEYILVNERQIALKPKTITFEQAAAMPVTGSSALQILDKLASVKAGSEVMINGATGGVGMFAIQLAKMRGAMITAVTSSKGVALAEKWGSDQVVVYQEQNILAIDKKFDVVIDLSGKLPFNKAKILLKPEATFVSTLPGPKEIIGSFFQNLFSKRKYRILFLKPTSGHLKTLARLANEGLDVVVDRTYPMTSFPEAYQEVPERGVLGKAVFRLS